jgi:hypothetical protein
MFKNLKRDGWHGFPISRGVFLIAHDLPEVLVNTDAHLDLFDSESEDASDYEELMEV